MNEKLNFTKKDFDLFKFINVNLIIFLPISLLIGSGVINLTIIIFDLLFLIDIFKKKNYLEEILEIQEFFKNLGIFFLIYRDF